MFVTYTSHEPAEKVADGSFNELIISGMAVVILCVVHFCVCLVCGYIEVRAYVGNVHKWIKYYVVGNILRVQIFAKQAKICNLEIVGVSIFVVGQFGTGTLASCVTKS